VEEGRMKDMTKRAREMSDADLARMIPILHDQVRKGHSLLFAMKQERKRRAEAVKREAKAA
jgi:hypothetical protein